MLRAFRILAASSLVLCGLAVASQPLAIPAQDAATDGFSSDGIMREMLTGAIPRDVRTFGLSRTDLLDYYARRNYQPLFYQDFNWRADTVDALKVMQASGDHGLKPANYWALGMDDLSQSYDLTNIARRDLVLTAATLRYASDIYNGRYPQSLKKQPSEILLDFDENTGLDAFLKGLAPQKPEYIALQGYLSRIRNLSSQAPSQIDAGPLLKRGISHPTVAQLRQHLTAAGDYSSTAAVADPAFFDDGLFEAVKSYQRRNGLSVDGIILEQMASSYSVLEQDEKELGVCLVDIGGGTTDIAVYVDGAIRHTAVIPIAGDQVTNDIAVALRTPTQYAEEIKMKYACALTQLAREDETIEVPSVGDRPPRQLARQTLAEVVEPRYEELLVLVQAELRRSGFEELLAAGVVLTGGSSKMEGVIELAEEVFHLPVRLGLPQHVGGLVEVVRNPIHATGVGLLLFGNQSETTGKTEAKSGSGFRDMLARMKSWFQGNF